MSAPSSSFALHTEQSAQGRSWALSSAPSHWTLKSGFALASASLLHGVWEDWQSQHRRSWKPGEAFCPSCFGFPRSTYFTEQPGSWYLQISYESPSGGSEMGSINLFINISYYKSFSSKSKINGIYNSKHSQRSEAAPQHLFLEKHFKCKEQIKNFCLTLIAILCQ